MSDETERLASGKNGERLRRSIRELDSPITRYIENDKGARLIIGEHPDSVFIAMDRPGFFTDDQVWEVIKALWMIRKKRQKG